jgi:hypothetical protein
VPRIALIQDGTEVARQRFADVAGVFERACATLSQEASADFALRAFTDEDVGYLLDGIEREEWSCLVFASNALLSGQVENAVTRHREKLHRYVADGGGVIVLHQQRDSLEPLLPAELLPETHEREAERGATAVRADDPNDLLLHFPVAVAWTDLRDLRPEELRRADDRGSELPSFFFKAIDRASLPRALKPVLSASDDEVVVARTDDHVRERVVLATAPLDWQSARPGQEQATAALLVNALRYAAVGSPRRLVWHRGEGVSNQLLVRWLAMDGGAALRPAPQAERPLDEIEAWLLSTVDLFVLPADRLPWVEGEADVERFLAQGGALVAAADVPPGVTQVTGVVGRYEERTLATRLYAELRAVEGWRSARYAFELRNIARALAFLWGHDEGELNRRDAAAIPPQQLGDDLADDLRRRLADPDHQEDLGSSIALAETLARVVAEPGKAAPHVAWLADEAEHRPADVALQIRAVLALADGRTEPDFLRDALAALEEAGSLAPVVRVLDAVSVLDGAGLLPEDTEHATRLGAVACRCLGGSRATPERGWASVEATAHVTRGLVALHARIAPDRPDVAADLIGHVATGATALRRALRRYERNVKGVAWLASIVHALIVADRAFPIGLQRLASLEWPDRQSGDAASERVERSLLQQLALENEKLRLGGRDLQRRLDEQLTQRLAAAIGRATATLVPTIVLAVAAVVVLRQVGWDSFGGLVANLVVLVGLVLTALTGLFALLARWNLLAGPAPRIAQWIADHVVPAVSAGGEIKRR